MLSAIYASIAFALALASANYAFTLALIFVIIAIRVPILVQSRKTPNGSQRFSPEFSGETGKGVKCTKLSTKSRKKLCILAVILYFFAQKI